jgi:hypothetical protein
MSENQKAISERSHNTVVVDIKAELQAVEAFGSNRRINRRQCRMFEPKYSHWWWLGDS